jgi:hypothetical protein
MFRRQPIDLRIGGRDRIDPAGHQPVDAAEHRILLVHQRRDAITLSGEQRRQRRIAPNPITAEGRNVSYMRDAIARPPAMFLSALNSPIGLRLSRPAGRM